jgi:hypothetical protein
VRDKVLMRVPGHSVSFSNCPTISPSTLVKVLNKTLTRAKQVTKKECATCTSFRPFMASD